MTQPSNSGDTIDAGFRVVPVRNLGGRPTKYLPEMCDKVRELGELGKSKTQIAASLKITRETLYAWCDIHPEFSDSVKVAEQLSQAWWEEQGQKGMWGGKKFNATAFIFQMKNRFREDYQDRVDTKHTLDVSAAFIDMLKLVSSGQAEDTIPALKSEPA